MAKQREQRYLTAILAADVVGFLPDAGGRDQMFENWVLLGSVIPILLSIYRASCALIGRSCTAL
jgi:hypothetical protein